MTTWDNIYKDFQNGWDSWATLWEEIHPLFKHFLDESNFKHKRVLDIWCGTGKYLKFLQEKNFYTDGIDSSETAVEMTKKNLWNESNVQCINMFEFEIPKNVYDMIISISTIHHGTKIQIQDLINKIYDALIIDWKTFITVPDFKKAKENNVWKDDQEIEIWTYAPTIWPEKWLAHSFYIQTEVKQLFSKFRNVKIKIDEIGRRIVEATK